MQFPTSTQLGMQLAWRFTEVLPYTFERDREKVRGLQFPVVAPLPLNRQTTLPLDGPKLAGPFIYALYAACGAIEYIGVAVEDGLVSPLDRWIRPNKEGTRDHWAHGTNKKNGGVVANMAKGLTATQGPYELHYTNYDKVLYLLELRANSLGIPIHEFTAMTPRKLLEELEHALVYQFQTPWNVTKKRSPPKSGILRIYDYWNTP